MPIFVVVDLGYDSGDSLTIKFKTNTGTPTSTSSRYWSMLVTQIPCTKGMLHTADQVRCESTVKLHIYVPITIEGFLMF